MSSQTTVTLYKWPECWGLPSLSAACIQTEAYLRLAGVSFAVEVCATSERSPTGQLPALERDVYLSPADRDEFQTARDIISYAKKHIRDLDASLSLGQRADLLAFSSLVETRLDVATTLTTWVEARGFSEYKKVAYGNRLPFPLNYVIPWSVQRDVRKRLPQHADLEKAYAAAGEVIDAVADRLRSSGYSYFFGSNPSSLDALLVGHLMYYRSSRAAAPVLADKVASQPALCEYMDRIMGRHFSVPATPRSALDAGAAGPSWSDAARGQKKPAAPKVEPTPAELQFRRNSKYWLLGAGAAVAAYILMSGKYVQFTTMLEDVGEDDGDDGEDDDDGDEE